MSDVRFEFGKNWRAYLSLVTEKRIARAERSLVEMIGEASIRARSFLDVGCGSGLFSLAAVRLGAERVLSFDDDPQSVACAEELRRRFCPDTRDWTIARASVLDREYLRRLGQWDSVYSWGVLHHTGDMWCALDNVASLVKDSGVLFISIYNDQGLRSRVWRRVKALYNHGPLVRSAVLMFGVPYFVLGGMIVDLVRGRDPRGRYGDRERGMSPFHDWLDWLGGYPFEVARPDEILEFYRQRDFQTKQVKARGRKPGCNEFVFVKRCPASSS